MTSERLTVEKPSAREMNVSKHLRKSTMTIANRFADENSIYVSQVSDAILQGESNDWWLELNFISAC